MVSRRDMLKLASLFTAAGSLPLLQACQRQQASLSEGETAFRVERQYGEFHRRFSLPDTADADGITANNRHGVLEIVIPKKAQVQPRRIEVNG